MNHRIAISDDFASTGDTQNVWDSVDMLPHAWHFCVVKEVYRYTWSDLLENTRAGNQRDDGEVRVADLRGMHEL